MSRAAVKILEPTNFALTIVVQKRIRYLWKAVYFGWIYGALAEHVTVKPFEEWKAGLSCPYPRVQDSDVPTPAMLQMVDTPDGVKTWDEYVRQTRQRITASPFHRRWT